MMYIAHSFVGQQSLMSTRDICDSPPGPRWGRASGQIGGRLRFGCSLGDQGFAVSGSGQRAGQAIGAINHWGRQRTGQAIGAINHWGWGGGLVAGCALGGVSATGDSR